MDQNRYVNLQTYSSKLLIGNVYKIVAALTEKYKKAVKSLQEMDLAFEEFSASLNETWVDGWTRDAEKAMKQRGKYLDI